MRELLGAVAYIHSKSIMHRDIKYENVKFAKPNEFRNIKLIDFGSARPYVKGSQELHYDICGSPYFASPEMLSGKGYNEKTDVWSCGVMFYHLLTGYFPYDGKSDLEVCHAIQQRQINFQTRELVRLPDVALKLLRGMLSRDMEQRLTALEARSHIYFQYDDLDKQYIKSGL